MTPAGSELPGIYRGFVNLLLRPWLTRRDRAEVIADVVELRGIYQEIRGRHGLARYTWRQLLQYPTQLTRTEGGLIPRLDVVMDSLVSDLRVAVRSLRRAPLLAVTVIGILAVAISANSTIFSVVHAVLIRPLPFPQPEDVVAIWQETTSDSSRMRLAPGTLVDAREVNSFEHVGAFMPTNATYTPVDGDPEILQGARVTLGYFETLRVAPQVGRVFDPIQYERGEKPVMVLGHDFWTRRFQSDPQVIGRDLLFGPNEYEVVGVMPPGLYPAEATIEGTMPLRAGGPDFWVPIRFGEEFYSNRTAQILGTVARLGASQSVVAGRTALRAASREFVADGRMRDGDALIVTPFRQEAVGAIERSLLFLVLTVAAVLLIAASNVAALLLTRAESRQGELAVRAALGAERWRLVRLQLIETFVLASLGGIVGIAGIPRLLAILRSAIPAEIPRLETAAPDAVVMAFTVGIVFAVTLASGLMPAIFATGARLLGALRRASGTGTASGGRQRVQSSLVVGQTALAVVLIVASALLTRSFMQLTSVDLGFDQTNVFAVGVSAPDTVSDDPVATAAFWAQLRESIADVPGVAEVGLGSDRPVERNWIDGFRIEGAENATDSAMASSLRRLGPGYLEALDVPVLLGRGVSAADRNDTAQVAFVNEALVNAYFDGENPVGRRITIPSLERIGFAGEVAANREIVGVVGDIHHLGPTAAPDPSIYLPLQQFEAYSAVLVVRDDGTRPDTAAAVKNVLSDIDRSLGVRDIEPLPTLVDAFTARERFATVLVSAFGAIGLALSAMGLYALVSRIVAYRTREYGLRLAVGAPASALVRDVFATALRPVAAGTIVGLAAAAPVALALRSQLFGIAPFDLTSYAAAPAVLIAVALLAGLLCARRAIAVDPIQALRSD